MDVGEEGTLSFRAGRHSLLWGESLFFGSNGIGNGMTSIDVIKALSVPSTQFKENCCGRSARSRRSTRSSRTWRWACTTRSTHTPLTGEVGPGLGLVPYGPDAG